MSKAAPRIPGDDEDMPASRAPSNLLNNAGTKTPNDVAAERENVVRAMAMAEAAKRGESPDLAPAPAIGSEGPEGPTSIKRKVMINGVEVETVTPVIRKNTHVAMFGPESRLPSGTPVKQDGTPCEGDEEAYGVIGDIITPQGRLVGRIIPVA